MKRGNLYLLAVWGRLKSRMPLCSEQVNQVNLLLIFGIITEAV